MKCGLIWARSARTSASIARVRLASSSARSSCPETHRATSSAARASPAVCCGENTWSVPTIRSSATSAVTTAVRTGQPVSPQGRSSRPKTLVPPRSTVSRASRSAWPAWWSPSPSHASSVWVSVSARAGLPSSALRCLIALPALSPVSPARSAGLASEAEWSVRNVARSPSDPRWVRRHARMAHHDASSRGAGSTSGSGRGGATRLRREGRRLPRATAATRAGRIRVEGGSIRCATRANACARPGSSAPAASSRRR